MTLKCSILSISKPRRASAAIMLSALCNGEAIMSGSFQICFGIQAIGLQPGAFGSQFLNIIVFCGYKSGYIID
jgi:hypothetical protein